MRLTYRIVREDGRILCGMPRMAALAKLQVAAKRGDRFTSIHAENGRIAGRTEREEAIMKAAGYRDATEAACELALKVAAKKLEKRQ